MSQLKDVKIGDCIKAPHIFGDDQFHFVFDVEHKVDGRVYVAIQGFGHFIKSENYEVEIQYR